MKRRTGIILISITLLIVAAFCIYKFVYLGMYMKKNPTCKDLKTEFTVKSPDLISECEKLDTAVNKKYNDKVLQIFGKVTKTIPGDSVTSVLFGQSNTDITIEICNMDNEMAKNLKIGDDVTIKALYITYLPADPLLLSMGDTTARGTITLKKGSIVK